MKEERKKQVRIILIILIILLLFLPLLIFSEIIGYIIQEQKDQKNQVQFYFYDETSNCSLGGYVFVGEQLVGKTEEGYFNLAYSNYIENFQNNKNISLFGKLGTCFGTDKELFFDKYWEGFKIEKYYFDGEAVFNFKTRINSHNPTKRELIGFIQPEKVKSELDKINIKQDTLENLSSINLHLNDKIGYVKDWEFSGENYWQTPPETLELGQGDCEDFSTTLLSLFLAYNPSLNCYNLIFSSHVTTFCKIGEKYIYYDQEKTELSKEIANRDELPEELEKLRKDYLEHYGINESERAYYAFSDKDYVEFINEEGLIDWQSGLGEKERFELFEELEKEVRVLEEKYPIELASEKPILAAEKPSLRGFFEENRLLVILLGIIFIILVIILIIVSRRREF